MAKFIPAALVAGIIAIASAWPSEFATAWNRFCA